MQQFNKKLLTNRKLVIHLRTREQAITFGKWLDSQNIKWWTNESYDGVPEWETYKNMTCLRPSTGSYADVDCYRDEDCKILSYEEACVGTKVPIMNEEVVSTDIKVQANGGLKEVAKGGVPKTMYQLVDPVFYKGVADILTFGAIKYEKDNWKRVDREEYARAIESHIQAYKRGEKNDPESGKSHMYHVACNAMFLDWMDRNGKA